MFDILANYIQLANSGSYTVEPAYNRHHAYGTRSCQHNF